VKTGDRVEADTPIATMYTSDAALLDDAEARLRAAVRIGDEPCTAPPLFHEV
jgi:thymidine phosphorylase